MGTPFLGEIKLVAFNFAPKGWAMCNGQFLPINQNQALFALFGTMYGGNGQTTFALPNLRGRVPIHMSGSHTQGEQAGSSSVTITNQMMPAHNHVMKGLNQNGLTTIAGITPDNTKSIAQALVSLQNQQTAPAQIYGTGAPDRVLAGNAVSNTGGSQPHNNMMPYLVLNYVVALQGVFPSRN